MLDRCLCDGKDNKSSEKNEEWSKVCFNGIRKGDWVKVRINMGMLKKFRGPFKEKEVHHFIFILENGEKWNLRRVAKFGGASSVQMDEDQHSADEHSSKTADGCSSYMLMDDDDLIHRDGDGGGRKGGDCSVGEGEAVAKNSEDSQNSFLHERLWERCVVLGIAGKECRIWNAGYECGVPCRDSYGAGR
ncbi:hypothetical protein NDU88_004834 [Pleurodeles waltl]|uniref:Uncharacterized protein n=1 Tax=Pleurodeles waltl TaxID=8319 RepID=A0AAV7LL00_PLEWA|nr:hypothetical protein NDU88_004834 [Pleurodeles waltl]